MSPLGRVLVTGGAGFVGSHMCERLLREGYEVLCVDSLLTGRKVNIAALDGMLGFEFLSHDVTNPLYVDGPLTHVLHMASPASPKDYALHSIHTLKVGALGTHNALGLAKAKGARFLLASTSEVYGDPEVDPQPETYWGRVNPIGPRSVYDEAKRFAESITMAYHRAHGLDVRIARIFNTYGPRMRLDDGRVLPNLISQALRDEPLTIYGDGTQTRAFCFVDDLVEGLLRLLTFDTAKHGADTPRVINLGNSEEITVLDLAARVIASTESRSETVFEPLPIDDPKVRCPDLALAKRYLDWAPAVSMESGLRETVAYFKTEMGLVPS